MMKSIEESVVMAMDGSDKELFPFLPYILQDLWEIGANPDAIVQLIKKHCQSPSELKVLDLGSGKGAISVKVSQQLGCTCFGMDAVPEFVAFAQQKAKEYNVNQRCTFEVGDIRERVKSLSGFDLIILGAIGPVFGDYFTTLTTLANCIHEKGMFIIDDAYVDDDSAYSHHRMSKKSDILQQIDRAGMQLIENDIMNRDFIKESDDFIFDKLKRRCLELIEKYPDRQKLFLDYIRVQEIENDVLENKVICTTLVIKRK